jgi:FkbM family methyltransferase
VLDLLRRITRSSVKRAVRLLYDSDFRRHQQERQRLNNLQRYQPGSTSLLGPPTRFIDSASFLSAYSHIFDDEIYDFDAERSAPVILDGGANVGLAILYWKRQYPDARITAFEPDPDIFDVLRWNCRNHGYDDVQLIQRGLWKEQTELQFAADGADGGHFSDVGQSDGKREKASIPTVRLRPFLNEPIDLLKLDVEGSETEVLLDCKGALERVKHLFVEYHSFVDQEQRLDAILQVLHDAGFRYHIQPELVSSQPFLKRRHSYGMDQRLNIFAYRP